MKILYRQIKTITLKRMIMLDLVIFLLENGHAKGLTEALEMLGLKEK